MTENTMKIKEYILIDEDGYADLWVTRRQSVFDKVCYVFLFKPSKNPRIKTKIAIRRIDCPMVCRTRVECEDGKNRVVSLVGNFVVAGNVFNQRGESLGPNNKDYYVRPITDTFDLSEFDTRFTDKQLRLARAGEDVKL